MPLHSTAARARRRRLVASVAAAALGAAGCAHRTRIESNPSAQLFVRDVFVCNTPCVYSTPATELDDHTPFRLEREGYWPITGTLETRVLPSRIIGGVFTLGLVPLFKWPRTYRALHQFDLRPQTRQELLAELDANHAAGAVTDDEYRALRLRLLGPP